MMKKTFKNIRTLAALLMAGAAFTACSSDDSIVEEKPVVNPSEPVYTLTIKASNDGASTRALDLDGAGKLTASWADGDQLTVVNVTKSNSPLGYMTASNASGNTADFTGTLSGTIDENDVLLLTYHPITSVSAFESQDGTLKGSSGAQEYDMATATVTVASVNAGKITATGDANFTTKVAMIKLTLQDNAATPNKLNATSLKVSASLMSGTINEDVLTFTIDDGATGAYKTNGDGILYYALPSAKTVAKQLAEKYSYYGIDETSAEGLLNAATITFTATVGCDTYTVNKTGYKFVAGKYYKATLTMTKQAPSYKMAAEATTADYGKVVCAAGHLHDAQTALPVGSTAVGILGRVTSTGHGLILALQNATNQTWNTINGWASVTTYASTTLKVLPDAARGSLTSYTKLGETTVSNWAVAQKNDYDEIFTNLGSTTGDSYGKVYDANVNAYITTGVGGTAISGSYWSATTNTDANAWRFGGYTWLSRSKSNSASVRPVLAF